MPSVASVPEIVLKAEVAIHLLSQRDFQVERRNIDHGDVVADRHLLREMLMSSVPGFLINEDMFVSPTPL